MALAQRHLPSRRSFCLCCIGSATFAATKGWLSRAQVFAEARELVELIPSCLCAAHAVYLQHDASSFQDVLLAGGPIRVWFG